MRAFLLAALTIAGASLGGVTVAEAAGTPAKIVATASGSVITATVSDAANAPIDGVPVRFTSLSSTGVPSTTCVATANGQAVYTAPPQTAGTVIVSADYNEGGAAATCASPGAQQITTSAVLGGSGTPPPAAAGTFASTPVYSSGAVRLALVVFNGGTLAQLDAALVAANAGGAWAQRSDGVFTLYIVGAPGFANDPFREAFPSGFAGVTSMTLVGK